MNGNGWLALAVVVGVVVAAMRRDTRGGGFGGYDTYGQYLAAGGADVVGQANGENAPGGFFQNVAQTIIGGVSNVSTMLDKYFNGVAWSNIRKLKPYVDAVRRDQNVIAFLHVIRHREHLPSVAHTMAAYNVLCGGGTFSGFADHPRPKLKSPCSRGAAGAYQITIGTWDGVVAEVGKVGAGSLPDFSPVNQERAAVYLLAYLGALPDVQAGRLAAAIAKTRGTWTSLPGANEDRGYTMAEAARVFEKYGGSLAG